jgi:hypothetical protein
MSMNRATTAPPDVFANMTEADRDERPCQGCGAPMPWVWIEGLGWRPPGLTCLPCAEEARQRVEDERIADALEIAVRVSLDVPGDISAAGGEIS